MEQQRHDNLTEHLVIVSFVFSPQSFSEASLRLSSLGVLASLIRSEENVCTIFFYHRCIVSRLWISVIESRLDPSTDSKR